MLMAYHILVGILRDYDKYLINWLLYGIMGLSLVLKHL